MNMSELQNMSEDDTVENQNQITTGLQVDNTEIPIDTHVSSLQQCTVDTVDTIEVSIDFEHPCNPTEVEDLPHQQESRSLRSRLTSHVYVLRFYSRNAVAQCVSGLFTGSMLLMIGIVFIVYFENIPIYIGIIFIAVSIPPCCMAANRYIHVRQQERRQIGREMRREARRRAREEMQINRMSSLPVADFPPSYSNLAFDDLHSVNADNISNVSSEITDSALPTYDEFLEMKKICENEPDPPPHEDFNTRS